MIAWLFWQIRGFSITDLYCMYLDLKRFNAEFSIFISRLYKIGIFFYIPWKSPAQNGRSDLTPRILTFYWSQAPPLTTIASSFCMLPVVSCFISAAHTSSTFAKDFFQEETILKSIFFSCYVTAYKSTKIWMLANKKTVEVNMQILIGF